MAGGMCSHVSCSVNTVSVSKTWKALFKSIPKNETYSRHRKIQSSYTNGAGHWATLWGLSRWLDAHQTMVMVGSRWEGGQMKESRSLDAGRSGAQGPAKRQGTTLKLSSAFCRTFSAGFSAMQAGQCDTAEWFYRRADSSCGEMQVSLVVVILHTCKQGSQ